MKKSKLVFYFFSLVIILSSSIFIIKMNASPEDKWSSCNEDYECSSEYVCNSKLVIKEFSRSAKFFNLILEPFNQNVCEKSVFEIKPVCARHTCMNPNRTTWEDWNFCEKNDDCSRYHAPCIEKVINKKFIALAKARESKIRYECVINPPKLSSFSCIKNACVGRYEK